MHAGSGVFPVPTTALSPHALGRAERGRGRSRGGRRSGSRVHGDGGRRGPPVALGGGAGGEESEEGDGELHGDGSFCGVVSCGKKRWKRQKDGTTTW